VFFSNLLELRFADTVSYPRFSRATNEDSTNFAPSRTKSVHRAGDAMSGTQKGMKS